MTISKMSSPLPTTDILGVKVAITNLVTTFRWIQNCVSEKRREYVCIAPVSTIMDAQRSAEYREVVNGAGLATPDGMPLVWIGRVRGFKTMDRTYGPDLLPFTCDQGRTMGLKHFFYGGSDAVCQKLEKRLNDMFPGVNIVGHYAPPYRPAAEREEDAVIRMINDAKPDILWVGLGSPKQDYWMRMHRELIHAPVMVGVGAAFDFISGEKAQAPFWMQRSGLEWLFRLCCEPKRLWKRYVFGNSLFVYLMLKQLITKGRI